MKINITYKNLIFLVKFRTFLSARRYASAGSSYGPVSVCLSVCPSVCLSVTSWCSVEVVGRIEMVFGVDAFFDQPYTVFYEIRVSTKIGVLPSGTFS